MADHRIWVFWNRAGSQTEEIWSQTSAQITGVQDVGISSVTEGPGLVRQGDNVTITVTVTNYGDSTQNTALTVRLNSTVTRTTTIAVTNGTSLPVTFSWNTTQLPKWGRYILTATVTAVPGENAINLGDNFWTGLLVRVSPVGDVNRDGRVNVADLAIVAFYYGATVASPNWNAAQVADVNHDGKINLADLALVAFYYGDSV
jgi:hypothetical protein